jgi:hypothetical protein
MFIVIIVRSHQVLRHGARFDSELVLYFVPGFSVLVPALKRSLVATLLVSSAGRPHRGRYVLRPP